MSISGEGRGADVHIFLAEVWSTALHGGMVENGGEWGGRGEENEQQEEVVENFRLF